MSILLIPVILSGGSGTRLWPLSREKKPKQFHALVHDELTMFEMTLLRARSLSAAAPIIVCNADHRFLVAEGLRRVGIDDAVILLEPCARSTAAAIAAAVIQAQRDAPDAKDPVLFVMPADHVIEDRDALAAAARAGMDAVQNGKIVTFGITPTAPHTGYGYIRTARAAAGDAAAPVLAFAEKPDLETAAAYVASGEYVWNSGMFMFSAADMIAAFETHAPDVYAGAGAALDRAVRDLDFIRLDAQAFAACPDISVDYAVMENLAASGDHNLVTVPLDACWSDVGDWRALFAMGKGDADGNVFKGNVSAVAAQGTYIHGETRLITALGTQNLVIVDTPDALFVADQARLGDMKLLVSALKTRNRPEIQDGRKAARPWGWYDVLEEGPGFKVKRIAVHPGASLSLQSHKHRAEHWVVVKGVAEVTRGDDILTLSPNESVAIPQGARHRLANPGREDLEIIEIQCGGYLGEDDITRYEDRYGRSS